MTRDGDTLVQHDQQAPDLEGLVEGLRAGTGRLSFFQTLVLLEDLLPAAQPIGHDGPAARERVRVRPSLSLACPPADVESITVEGGRVQIDATFLGLYGADSPLPSYYAEHLAQIRDDRPGERVRAFLDLFHHRLYSLLFRSWRRGRFTAGRRAAESPLYDRVLSLVGFSRDLGLGGMLRPRLAEVRMRALSARTARGLRALLELRLGHPCEVRQLELRRVDVPATQRSALGRGNCVLGDTLLVGSSIVDRNKLCVAIRAEDFDMYCALLPEGRDREQLDDAMASYMHDPLDYDVEVRLGADHVPAWTLGGQGALGRTAWLGRPVPEAVCRFPGRAAPA